MGGSLVAFISIRVPLSVCQWTTAAYTSYKDEQHVRLMLFAEQLTIVRAALKN